MALMGSHPVIKGEEIEVEKDTLREYQRQRGGTVWRHSGIRSLGHKGGRIRSSLPSSFS
ncbi:hypothetical protein ACLOJK_014879 [Asimina triloba]